MNMSSYDGSRSTLKFEYTVHRSTGWALDEGVPMSCVNFFEMAYFVVNKYQFPVSV